MLFIMLFFYNVIMFSQGTEEMHSAPGAPQERSSQLDSHAYIAQVKELQRRYTIGPEIKLVW